MEQTQNKLIEENINLKNKLSPSERKIFEKENQVKNSNLVFINNLFV